jgi:hypothetical protein
MTLPDDWRFRTNWRGKLILQRRVRTLIPVGPRCDWVLKWRDADVEDLRVLFEGAK